MIFATPETAFYYTDLVRKQRRDWFLPAMFLPEEQKNALIALYALDIELAHVHHIVKEEMMGHIRYAWWHEGMEEVVEGKKPREHPVLQAVANIKIAPEFLLNIIGLYREKFPELPENVREIVQKAARELLANNSASKKWQNATRIIETHRAKHGANKNNFLIFKLLFV
jgi:phytoene/squalene synthetase